ncbi:hypothetical protein MMPV_003614 [Pyropia vietnamensis]
MLSFGLSPARTVRARFFVPGEGNYDLRAECAPLPGASSTGGGGAAAKAAPSGSASGGATATSSGGGGGAGGSAATIGGPLGLAGATCIAFAAGATLTPAPKATAGGRAGSGGGGYAVGSGGGGGGSSSSGGSGPFGATLNAPSSLFSFKSKLSGISNWTSNSATAAAAAASAAAAMNTPASSSVEGGAALTGGSPLVYGSGSEPSYSVRPPPRVASPVPRPPSTPTTSTSALGGASGWGEAGVPPRPGGGGSVAAPVAAPRPLGGAAAGASNAGGVGLTDTTAAPPALPPGLLAYTHGDAVSITEVTATAGADPLLTLHLRSNPTAVELEGLPDGGARLLIGCANGDVVYYADVSVAVAAGSGGSGGGRGSGGAAAVGAAGSLHGSTLFNKDGAAGARVTAVRWVPGSPSRFIATAVDGAVVMYDAKFKATPGRGSGPSIGSAGRGGSSSGSGGGAGGGGGGGGSTTDGSVGDDAGADGGGSNGGGGSDSSGSNSSSGSGASGLTRKVVGGGAGSLSKHDISVWRPPRGKRQNPVAVWRAGCGSINDAAFAPPPTPPAATGSGAANGHAGGAPDRSLALGSGGGNGGAPPPPVSGVTAGATVLALACRDGYLRVLDLASEQQVVSFRSYYGALLTVSWSPDALYLATGGEDDLVSVWSPWELRIVARGEGHTSWVSGVCWDPMACGGGRYRVGSVAQDAKLLLWDFDVDSLHVRSPRRPVRLPSYSRPHGSSDSVGGSFGASIGGGSGGLGAGSAGGVGGAGGSNASGGGGAATFGESAHGLKGTKLARGIRHVAASAASSGLSSDSAGSHTTLLAAGPIKAAANRAEVPTVDPVAVHVAHVEPLTAILFYAGGVLTAATGGEVKVWGRPPTAAVPPLRLSGSGSEWPPPPPGRAAAAGGGVPVGPVGAAGSPATVTSLAAAAAAAAATAVAEPLASAGGARPPQGAVELD